MTTTIGSLDLNAFNDLYSDSNQYFWFESNSSATYGAGVHVTLSPETSFIANPSGQNILMNTDGISLRNGLLPMMTLDNDSLDFNLIDTTSSTYANVATFGLQTRIGRNETGYSRILIDPSSNNVDLINAFDVFTPDDISAFSQKVDTTRTTNDKNFINYSDNVYALTSQAVHSYYSTTTVSETFTIDDLNNVTSGEVVNIVLRSRLAMNGSQQRVYTYMKFSVDVDIVKGTSSTTNISNVRGAGVVWSYYSPADSTTYTYTSRGITHAISVSYDGNNQVTITSTITMISTSDGFTYLLTTTYISQISYIESTIFMPVVFQSGDVVLSHRGVGRVFLGTSENDALLSAINSLGWNSDVVCGVTISPSSTCISNTSLYPTTTTLTAITVPPHLEVTWTSLSEDLSVTNTGTVSYTGEGGLLDDKPEIQASVLFAGKTYTDTCYVNPYFVG